MADMFQLICPSDANANLHPNNKPNSFTVTFPEPLQFNENDWEVALQSVSLPNSYLNWTVAQSNHNRIGFRLTTVSTDSSNPQTVHTALAFLPQETILI